MSNMNENNDDILNFDLGDSSNDVSVDSMMDTSSDIPLDFSSSADSLFDTPSEPVTSADSLFATPSEPASSADSLFATPSEPTSSADSLFATPSEPASSADSLFDTPSEPASSADSLFDTPSEPASSADSLFDTPSETPSSVAEKPLFDEPAPVVNEADSLFGSNDMPEMTPMDAPTPAPSTLDDMVPQMPPMNDLPKAPENPNLMKDLTPSDEPMTLAGSPYAASLEDDAKAIKVSTGSSDEESLEDSSKKGKKAKKEKKPKKEKGNGGKPSKLTIVLASVAAFLLVIGGLALYLLKFNEVTSNAIYATVLKPVNYYKKVELANITNTKTQAEKDFDTNFSAIKKLSQKSASTASTITLGKGVYNLAPNLGSYASILTSLKSVTFKTDSYVDDNMMSFVVEALINNQTITVFNIKVDKKTSTVYVQCPTLCKRWFSYTPDEQTLKSLEKQINLDAKITITGKDVAGLIERYSKVILNVAQDVTNNKNVTINNNDSKMDVRELLVALSPEDVSKFLGGILLQAKDDNFTCGLLVELGLVESKTEYTKKIDKLIKDAEKEGTKDIPAIDMHVYVDKVGDIVGRQFVIKEKDDTTTINYATEKSSTVTKFTYSMKYDGYEGNLSITDTNNNNKHNGTIKFNSVSTYTADNDDDVIFEDSDEGDVSEEDITSEDIVINSKDSSDELNVDDVATDEKFGFTINYNNYEVVDASKGLINGDVTFEFSDMPELIDIGIALKMKAEGEKQTNALSVTQAKVPFITLTNVGAPSTQKDVKLPEAALKFESVAADKVTQYNLLLELNITPMYKGIVTAFNNKLVTVLLTQSLKESGYLYFNGKQTPATLLALSKVDPTISEIFLAGYKATKAGLNPGLDAASTITGTEGTEGAADAQTTPNSEAPADATTGN